MDYRRFFLTSLFIAVVGWLTIYLLSPVLFFPIVLLIPYLFLDIMPRISLVFAVIVFFMSKKWFSVERALSLLLIMPIMLTAVIPFFREKINLYKTPTTTLIRSYFKTFEYSQPKVLDLSDPFTTFDNQNKTLEINIRLIPDWLSYDLDIYRERNYGFDDESFAKFFMNQLKLNYVGRTERINEFNLKADHIIVHGYWGDELIVEVYYTKINDEYIVTEPYPNLKLIVENGEGFLLYQHDGSIKKLKVYENKETNSYLEFNLHD